MILNRLYELAIRKQLLDDAAFENQPVPYLVVLDEGGKFLGVDVLRGETVTVKKTKKGEVTKRTPDRGIVRSIPRPHGNTASQGFARFFVDTLPRVLPVPVEEKDRAKVERSRSTFWDQIGFAADETSNPALRAVQDFGRKLGQDEKLAAKVRTAVAEKDVVPGGRVTFSFHPDGGKTILDRPDVRKWFAEHFQRFTAGRQQDGPIGFCTLTGEVGPLPTSHPIKLNGIPGGLAMGVSLVSFDKAAFEHYGLDGAVNASIGFQGADGYARGFQWLRAEKDHHFTIGGTLFLFWTRRDASTDFVMALSESSPEQVKHMLDRVGKGQWGDAIDDVDDFYLLAVSGNSARAIIRDYLETPLGQARAAIGRWFDDLRIADSSREYQGQPNSAFPMWMLANATALEADRVSPASHARLMHAALTAGSLPDSILAACVGRLRADGSEGFRAARMALIKLCLNRNHCKEYPMTEVLDPNRTADKAYACGRLLALLARCQSPQDFGTSAQLLERFFGTASTSPRSVFPSLLRLNRHHIAKIRDEMPGFAFNLEAELEERLQPLRTNDGSTPDFPSLLSLPGQGQFALGFYHQRAEYRRKSEQTKAEKVGKAATK
jgi:CRISPR-associated protein Csd1